MTAFASSFYILFCHVWLLSIRNLLYLNEIQEGRSEGDRRRGWEDFRGVDKLRETKSRADYMRKESNFNKKKTKIKM